MSVWQRRAEPPPLGAPPHVWRADLDRLSSDEALLDEAERLRARRFVFATDRERFVAEHGLQRRLLGAYGTRSPASLAIAPDYYGKPRLSGTAIAFNGSESAGIALFAVAEAGEIGIDIEVLRPERADMRIARRYFHPAEIQELESLADEARLAAFFAVWTRKEALVKAVGMGLRIPLASFRVGVLPDEPAGPLGYESDWPASRGWRLVSLPLGPGHAGTVALTEGLPDPLLFEWAGG